MKGKWISERSFVITAAVGSALITLSFKILQAEAYKRPALPCLIHILQLSGDPDKKINASFELILRKSLLRQKICSIEQLFLPSPGNTLFFT